MSFGIILGVSWLQVVVFILFCFLLVALALAATKKR